MKIARQLSLSLFRYDESSGDLYWLNSHKKNPRVAGRLAGTISVKGYRVIGIGKQKIYAHQIVWLMHNGPIEDGLCIDHIDGNTLNNRIDNLRATTLSKNQRNRRLIKTSSTGIHGVTRHSGGYSVSCANQYITYNKDFFEACCARKSAELRMGFHSNHGRVIA